MECQIFKMQLQIAIKKFQMKCLRLTFTDYIFWNCLCHGGIDNFSSMCLQLCPICNCNAFQTQQRFSNRQINSLDIEM